MLSMFNVPFAIFECFDWKNKKQKLSDLSLQQQMDHEVSVKTDFFMNDRGKKYRENISQLFAEEIDVFQNQLQIDRKMVISQAWFEFAEKGMHHMIHNHGATGFSAICYLEYLPDIHTSTRFIAPYNNFLTGQTLDCTFNVIEGVIIFFPSVIHHYTIPNQSDVVRKVVSFNLVPE